ncbi:hypothetical protein PVL29_004710 [Vitis rotundifolia]|uniref:Uncharacterized protein n=1 Tax=Vitis rotundifolia TaxID=103349 RepID=A0AA39A9P7_VITRO|nr:hypothetical protein PVL29_004710 [Vitis rotundifolia]
MDSHIDARLGRMETQMDDLTFFIDGFSKVIGFGFNTRALTIAHETMPIPYTLSDAATKIFTSTIDILDSTGQVDGEIFIQAINTGVDDGGEVVTPILEIHDHATTPMLEDIDQVATLVSEKTNKVVDSVIGA